MYKKLIFKIKTEMTPTIENLNFLSDPLPPFKPIKNQTFKLFVEDHKDLILYKSIWPFIATLTPTPSINKKYRLKNKNHSSKNF